LINKLVFANLKHRPIRTLLSLVAIGVEVTMILTLVGLSEGTLEDSARRARGVGADVVLRAPNTSLLSASPATISAKSMLDFLLQQPHVQMATGTVVYPIGLLTTVTGLDLEEFDRMSGGFKFVAGQRFQKPDDIIVDEYYAMQNGLKLGSTVSLLNRKWVIRGIVEPGKLARVILPRAVLQDMISANGKFSQVFVKLDDPANISPVIASLKKLLPDYPIYSVPELASLYSVDSIPELRVFIKVVIGLSVVVGFLVVFLSMYTAVLERTREIGILKALGASPAYVLNLVFRETIVLAIAGAVIGIFLTYGSRLAIEVLAPATLRQKIVPHWWPIATGIAVAGALLGAMYPAWKAARQDAIEALSYE
jgi:putative ABC transport system permease protein